MYAASGTITACACVHTWSFWVEVRECFLYSILISLTSPKTRAAPPIPGIRDARPNLDPILLLAAHAGSFQRAQNGSGSVAVDTFTARSFRQSYSKSRYKPTHFPRSPDREGTQSSYSSVFHLASTTSSRSITTRQRCVRST